MDVRCRQCGTEYELDDARVGTTGTTVKCSSCAYVFKVMPSGDTREASGAVRPVPSNKPDRSDRERAPSSDTPILGTPPSQPPQAAAPQAAGDWMVKKADGQVFRFRELTTLQKWIVERKVVRDDEISRTGKSWKKLGEIAELTSFFQVVEAADAAQRSVSMSQMPQVHLTATPTGTFQAYPLQAAQASPSSSSPATLMPPERLPSAPAQAQQQPAPGLAPQQQAGLDAEVDLDDDDPVLAWQRRRRQGMMGAAAAVAVVVVIAAVLTLRGSGHDDVPASVRSQVQTALSQGDAASRDRALKALEDFTHSGADAAVAAAPVRARILAEEARGLREAIRLSDEAKAIAVAMQAAPPTGTTDPTAVAHAEQVLAEAGAIVMSSRAAGHDLADVDLATATAALATGDLSALQAATTLAREHAQAEDATTRAAVDDELRLILSLAEASQVLPTDTDAAQVATEKLARFGDVRARAATAVISLVAVRGARLKALAQTPPVAVDGAVVERARAAFAALPVSDPRRAAAEGLLSALTALPPPPPEPVVDPTAVPGTPGTPVTVPTPVPGDAAVPAVEETFDALMARGEKALVTERSAVAYEAFKKATQKNPASARAWLKLGWASLDSGKKSDAPRAFERALAVSPSLVEARFGLAEALRFAGRTDEAIAAYKAYLAQDPTGKDANIAKNALKQLE